MAWLSARQYRPEGGFSGRTNKLVDACYSHWVGGCWPLIAEALQADANADGQPQEQPVPSIFDREGLGRYILCCAQGRSGGLRDKPSRYVGGPACRTARGRAPSVHVNRCKLANEAKTRRPDGYHSCYALAGLSSIQHQSAFRPPAEEQQAPHLLDAAFAWHRSNGTSSTLNDILEEPDFVEPVHPIFVIPFEAVTRTQAFFRQKTGL